MSYPDGVYTEYLKEEHYRIQKDESTLAYSHSDRLSKWYCGKCGTPYEIITVPDMKCEFCGRKLEKY